MARLNIVAADAFGPANLITPLLAARNIIFTRDRQGILMTAAEETPAKGARRLQQSSS